MTIIPPYLKPGDLIGIMCPAGYISRKKVTGCVSALKKAGYRVQIGKTIGGRSKNYFSADDDGRLGELQEMIQNRNIRAILFARGGYGSSRIIDRLDLAPLKKNPKWLIGFSDITVFHNHLLRQCRMSSIHGPMAAAFSGEPGRAGSVKSLLSVLSGKPISYKTRGHTYDIPGTVTGELAGGNLAILAHTLGTPSECPFKDKILFIEDVGEYYYNLDRMMVQLRRSGSLEKIKGIIVGGFSEMKDTVRPFGKKSEEIIRDAISSYRIPAAFGFPVSHSKRNYALKTGIRYTLRVTGTQTMLEEK